MSSSAGVHEPARHGEHLAAQHRGSRAVEVGSGQLADGSAEVVRHDREGQPGGVGTSRPPHRPRCRRRRRPDRRCTTGGSGPRCEHTGRSARSSVGVRAKAATASVPLRGQWPEADRPLPTRGEDAESYPRSRRGPATGAARGSHATAARARSAGRACTVRRRGAQGLGLVRRASDDPAGARLLRRPRALRDRLRAAWPPGLDVSASRSARRRRARVIGWRCTGPATSPGRAQVQRLPEKGRITTRVRVVVGRCDPDRSSWPRPVAR